MYRIALCDTNAQDLKNLKEKIELLAEQRHLEVLTECFRNAKALCDATRERSFALVLLEIEIGGSNGIDVARRIRFYSPETAVIFVSTREEYALAAYAAFPVGYLLKPVTPAKLREPFLHALAKRKRTDIFFLPTLDGGKVRVDPEELLYVEVFGSELNLHCKQEVLHAYGSLNSVVALLPAGDFYRSHRNCVVNLRYVQKIERYFFGMRNGEMVSVAKNRFTEAREVFESYLSD